MQKRVKVAATSGAPSLSGLTDEKSAILRTPTDSNNDDDEDSISESDLPIDDMTSIIENYLRWEKKRKS